MGFDDTTASCECLRPGIAEWEAYARNSEGTSSCDRKGNVLVNVQREVRVQETKESDDRDRLESPGTPPRPWMVTDGDVGATGRTPRCTF